MPFICWGPERLLSFSFIPHGSRHRALLSLLTAQPILPWTNSNSIYECYLAGNLNVGCTAVNPPVQRWGHKLVQISNHGQILLLWLHIRELVWKVKILTPHTVVPTADPSPGTCYTHTTEYMDRQDITSSPLRMKGSSERVISPCKGAPVVEVSSLVTSHPLQAYFCWLE